MNQNIYFFWEPTDRIPAYLELCMQTWQRAFRGHQIIHLSHANLGQYISPGSLPIDQLKRVPLSQQKDALSIAVLNEHGGIFMDADTIAVRDPAAVLKALERTELVLFGNHLAFLAARPNSDILRRWLTRIRIRLENLEDCAFSPGDVPWDYTGYRSLDEVLDQLTGIARRPLAQSDNLSSLPWTEQLRPRTIMQRIRRRLILSTVLRKQITRLDRRKSGFIMEAGKNPRKSGNPKDAYLNFWFGEDTPLTRVFSKDQSVIGLHNSWTPEWYRGLSTQEVMRHKCLLSKTLCHVLQSQKAA